MPRSRWADRDGHLKDIVSGSSRAPGRAAQTARCCADPLVNGGTIRVNAGPRLPRDRSDVHEPPRENQVESARELKTLSASQPIPTHL